MPSPFKLLAALLGSLLLVPGLSIAQNQVTSDDIANRVGAQARDRLLEGKRLLEAQDPRSVGTLRDAAQSGLTALAGATGKIPLQLAPATLDDNVVTSTLLSRTAEAHFFWGNACETFAKRDEAITAYARALRLSELIGGIDPERENIESDARGELTGLLAQGLPLVAPDDVLDAIARLAHGGLWTPRETDFDPAPLSNEVGGKPFDERDLLITDGVLFPPRIGPIGASPLYVIPSLYQGLDTKRLAPSMLLNQAVVGFIRDKDGPNKGQWRQLVRVYYASPRLTRDKRPDLPRARELAQQFLEVQSLFQAQLGVTNLYTRGDLAQNVTTLWLMEVSSNWPNDEDDPVVQAQLGPQMPAINIGPDNATEPETDSLTRAWTPIAAQNEGAPGEVMFWRSGFARPENEWARELMHEYGHVSLPPLGGFKPPLEPYANGLLGETLGMMWAASLPDTFETDNKLRTAFLAHVRDEAVPARQSFILNGPTSSLRFDTSANGLHYLQGLNVYLERVYGGELLGRVYAPLNARAAQTTNLITRSRLLNTQSLFGSLDTLGKNAWGGDKSISLYLPAALNLRLDEKTLAMRDGIAMTRGMKLDGWLFLPDGVDSLRIDGPGTQNLSLTGWPTVSGTNAVRVNLSGKTGWQRISLQAKGDLKILSARIERK